MSRYFLYGYQARSALNWNAGQGGVMPGLTRAPSSSLGAADLVEAGLTDPIYEPDPALAKARARLCKLPKPPCGLRAAASADLAGLGDWPLVRPAGPEPEAMGAIPVWSGLSNNEKALVVGAAGVLAFFWWKRSKRGRRRNPWTVTSRSRGVTGTLKFTSKRRAKEYAEYLRSAKPPKPAKIRHVKR